MLPFFHLPFVQQSHYISNDLNKKIIHNILKIKLPEKEKTILQLKSSLIAIPNVLINF